LTATPTLARQSRRRILAVWAALLIALTSLAGPMLVAAQTAQDPSNVVLVFDVSNSILLSDDGANAEFADVLEGIADRVEETASELAVGNATMSFVVFGRTAVVYPAGCERLSLHDDPAQIAKLEDCLRAIAGEYRAGRNAPVRQVINTQQTDHVAALRAAAALLPDKTTRSAVIFFTDGENDPPGTARDNENVVARIAAAYEGRSPLAILPVGLGAEAGNFEPELRAIYDAYFRDMEACEGRAAFSWPEVAFPSADEAGTAVAQALQEVTCSFTFVPTPTAGPPTPSPEPTPTAPPPGAPVGVQLLAGNRSITVQWLAPTEGAEQVAEYLVRCKPEQGTDADWKEVTVPAAAESGPLETVFDGLEPGQSYVCGVAASDGTTSTEFAAAGAAIVALGIPGVPTQPRAEPGDNAARLTVDPIVGGAPVEQYAYECTAPDGAKVTGAGPQPAVVIGNLVNGTSYTCVAFAENRIGRSAPSVASASFSPCGSFFDCNPLAKLGGGALVLLAIAIVAALAARRYLWRNRVWITAQIDGGENRSLGWGPEVGVRLQREEGSWFALLEPFEGSKIRVRYRGAARFIVNGGVGIKDVHQGDPAPVRDNEGNIHQIIIRKYRTKPRDRVSPGRTAKSPEAPRPATAAEAEETEELTARIEGRDDDRPAPPPPDTIG
jgi:hypothetical protein